MIITRTPMRISIGGGGTDLPSYYSWTDRSIAPETPYYYYVESISMGGVREQFTPIIAAEAKRAGSRQQSEKSEKSES